MFPRVVVSVQAIINCRVGGTCYGGDSSLLFQLAQAWKIPLETCQTYRAKNPLDWTCPDANKCVVTQDKKPVGLPNYNYVSVKKWGRVRGVADMKKALVDGPIVCDIMVNDAFENYVATADMNIFNSETGYLYLNHAISVVGWGTDAKQGDYWIGRNSWGKEWGYDGFFFIKAGANVIGIESDCTWVTPEYNDFQ